jgi:hypothetical protein
LARLRRELENEGKGRFFEALQGFLIGEQEGTYQQTADMLGLSLGTVRASIFRMRVRYRALLREEVARTVATEDQVEEELRYLRASVSA